MTMKISVLGAGAWGTALAIALAARNDVRLWGRDEEAMRRMAERRVNDVYLPGFPFPDRLRCGDDLADAIAHVAVPSSLLIVASTMARKARSETRKFWPNCFLADSP